MNRDKKHIAILGAGESGIGAAILAKKQGWEVFVSDKGSIDEKYKEKLKELGVKWEEGQHSKDEILNSDIIVKSPGIPDSIPLIKKAKDKGIKVISEIEFAGYYNKAKTICITGSNGKTTTALWLHHILKKAGINVGLAGNIGDSFAKQVATEEHDWYVLELSSFQLDGMYDFKADISIILNITPDHLDRYEYKMQNYIDSKFRIIQNQTTSDWVILDFDDPILQKEVENRNITPKIAWFSYGTEQEQGGYIKNKEFIININNPKNQFNMSIHDLALKGKHNAKNALAASIASRILDIRKEVVRESLMDFTNVEHRMEFVASVHGIEFINDSKATNVNATWFALESIEKPIIWVAGGVDKGNDYSQLKELVKDKVKAIICLGENNQKIIEEFKDDVDTILEAKSAIEAVAYGYQLGKKGDTVLLSPACASFDLFENYEHRGKEFKKAVRSL